jgi:hypothetical protein
MILIEYLHILQECLKMNFFKTLIKLKTMINEQVHLNFVFVDYSLLGGEEKKSIENKKLEFLVY